MRTLFLLLAMVLPVMAGREFVAGSSQLGVYTLDAPISPPITIATFAWSRQNTASQAVVAVNTTTNAGERVQLNVLGATAGDPINASINDAASGTSVVQGAAFVTNRWQHIAATYTSATLRVLYVDGSPVATNTTSVTVNGLNQVVVGSRKATSFGGFYTGGLAEVAVWSEALTDMEIQSLADGMSPLLIRPTSRVFYSPLTGQESGTEWNYDGAPLSLTNSPAPGTSHPRMYYP